MWNIINRFLLWSPLAVGGIVAFWVSSLLLAATIWDGAKREAEAEWAWLVWAMTTVWIPVGAVFFAIAWLVVYLWTQDRQSRSRIAADLIDAHTRAAREQRLRDRQELHRQRLELPSAIQKSPIVFAGLVEAKNTPKLDYTAVRIIVRNQSDQNLEGLVARLIGTLTSLGGLSGDIDLPLVLATKARLDRLRNPAIKEPLPSLGFNLHAHSEKPIEVVWLHSKGALEGFITHQAGEAEFLFVGSQDFHIEVTGAGKPIMAVVRINVADDDHQSWTPELIVEAVGEAHG